MNPNSKQDYLFIQSKDPLENRSVMDDLQMVRQTIEKGHSVSLYLVNNGVFNACAPAVEGLLRELSDKGVNIQIDNSSASLRGIGKKIFPFLSGNSEAGVVVDSMARGAKVLWL